MITLCSISLQSKSDFGLKFTWSVSQIDFLISEIGIILKCDVHLQIQDFKCRLFNSTVWWANVCKFTVLLFKENLETLLVHVIYDISALLHLHTLFIFCKDLSFSFWLKYLRTHIICCTPVALTYTFFYCVHCSCLARLRRRGCLPAHPSVHNSVALGPCQAYDVCVLLLGITPLLWGSPVSRRESCRQPSVWLRSQASFRSCMWCSV